MGTIDVDFGPPPADLPAGVPWPRGYLAPFATPNEPTPEQRLAAVASALDGIVVPVLSADVVAVIREALA